MSLYVTVCPGLASGGSMTASTDWTAACQDSSARADWGNAASERQATNRCANRFMADRGSREGGPGETGRPVYDTAGRHREVLHPPPAVSQAQLRRSHAIGREKR